MKVACFHRELPKSSRIVANAMLQGIKNFGDEAFLQDIGCPHKPADAAVIYGYKFIHEAKRYPQFVWADLGYWQRATRFRIFRLSVGGWSPHKYVMRGHSIHRLRDTIGVTVSPWSETGTEILIAGSSPKSCRNRGVTYMGWETDIARKILERWPQEKVMYRPKPRDSAKHPIPGVGYDSHRTISEALASAKILVTHHSNCSIDALVAGVPTYCEVGAAAACSVDFNQIANPPRLEHRQQFLQDVAYLQWSTEEMRSGECWKYLRQEGLIR